MKLALILSAQKHSLVSFLLSALQVSKDQHNLTMLHLVLCSTRTAVITAQVHGVAGVAVRVSC